MPYKKILEKIMNIQTHENLLVYNPKYTVQEINNILKENNLDGLRFFCFFEEDRVTDFSFLKEITHLNTLSLFLMDEVTFDFLYDLASLKSLHIQTLFFPIDFARLPQLNTLSLQWNKSNVINLHALRNLSHLSISEFTEGDLEVISTLTSLRSLAMATAKCKTLKGIEKLVNLEALSIGAFRQLADISAISGQDKLRYLEFDICPKMRDFSPLGKLQNLEILELLDCKNLESIQFVKDMKKLEQLSILGTTVVNDFDLTPAANIARVYGGFGKKYNISLKDKELPNARRSFKGFVMKSINN